MAESSKPRTTILAGCAAHGIQDGLSTAIYVLLPILAQAFGLNLGQVGLFKGLKSLAQASLEIISGHATERYGARHILLFGLLLSGAGYGFLSFANGPTIVLLSLVVIGAGGAFHHAPASALISGAFAQRGRRRALGVYNSSGDAGKLIFTAVISLAMLAALSWESVALFYGLVSLIAGIGIFQVLKLAQIGDSSKGLGDAAAGTPDTSLGWGILDRRKFSALLATVFLDSMVQVGVLTFVAFVMIAKGVPTTAATLAAVLVLIGGMFGKALCGFLAENIGVRPAFAILQGLTALGLVLLVISSSTVAFALLPILGVVVQGTTSITYVIVNELIHPTRTARGYSIIYAASGIASVIGPVGFGTIGDRFGIETSMLVMAVIAICAILPSWFLKTNIPLSSKAV